mmetsp:Transcript_42876/g.111668  ORF Transcript_42876/g.111668 Transcript_42876/m.111668 type:complete len:210 (-) Transcript_42876:102-731(-)
MPVAQELWPAATEEWKQAAAALSPSPSACDGQEADVLLANDQALGESPEAPDRRDWRPLRLALGAMVLACLLATAAGAVAQDARRLPKEDPAQLRRLDRAVRFEDSRNPSLRRVAAEEEGNIADDITAAFSVQGVYSEGDAEDGAEDEADEAQPSDEQQRAPLRREAQGEEETRDERSFARAFQEAGGAEEGDQGQQQAFEELIKGLPS